MDKIEERGEKNARERVPTTAKSYRGRESALYKVINIFIHSVDNFIHLPTKRAVYGGKVYLYYSIVKNEAYKTAHRSKKRESGFEKA